jgi:hypothetical protein
LGNARAANRAHNTSKLKLSFFNKFYTATDKLEGTPVHIYLSAAIIILHFTKEFIDILPS